MFAVFGFEVVDEAGQHPDDLLVPRLEWETFPFLEVLSLDRDDELGADLATRAACAVATLREMAVRRLLESSAIAEATLSDAASLVAQTRIVPE